MSGAKVAAGTTCRRDTPERVSITASPSVSLSATCTQQNNWGRKHTWPYVLPIDEASNIRNGTLTRTEPIRSATWHWAACNTQRPDPIRVTERYDPKACEHGNARIRTPGLGHESAHGDEDVLLVDAEFSGFIQMIRKDVEEQLGIGRGVDVSVRDGIHEM